MLTFCHFQIHDPTRVKVTGVVPPITLIAPGLNLGLTVAPNLTPGVLVSGQVWAPPIIPQLLGDLMVVEMSHDYEN